MILRILMPVVEDSGLQSRLAEHFGRTPYFSILEVDEKGVVKGQEVVPNAGEHFGGGGRRADFIMGLKPDVIIVYGMGPRGLQIYQSVNVAVLQAKGETVEKVFQAYRNDELEELTRGCHEAKHP